MGIQGLSFNVLGMQASQAGLRITNHNIANSNTENYSRKISLQNTITTQKVALKRLPIGVKVDDVIRAKNIFLDNQYRTNLTQEAYYEKLAAINEQLTAILGKPSEELLVTGLQDFYKAANDLSQNPESETNRKAFLINADKLASAFNTTHRSLDVVKESLNAPNNGELKKTVDLLNIKFQKLSLAQKQINILRANDIDVSSLEDERDALVNDLNKFSDLNIKLNQAGDFYQVRTGLHPVPNAEAIIQGSVIFPNLDSAIVPAITTGNRQLDLTVNNGNGSTVNFLVSLPENATPRDVVKSINEHFRAAGGKGSVAAIDTANRLILETRLVEDSKINSTNSISINPTTGSILTTLGLPAAPVSVNGANPLEMALVDTGGLNYTLGVEFGNDKITDGVQATRIIVKESGVKAAVISINSGTIGAQLKAINQDIPKVKEELSILAMGIKELVNGLFNAGTTSDNSPGIDLFTGTNAANFKVSPTVLNNTSRLALGEIKNAGGISVGENTIISKIAELFNDGGAFISTVNSAQKFYLKANNASAQISKLALVPGMEFNINVSGLIRDANNTFNAADNGLGGDSLVQVQFLDANLNPIGAAGNLSGLAAPNENAIWTGIAPAGASFISVNLNGTSFADNNLLNNYGHFEVEIRNSSDSDNLSYTLNSALLTSLDRIATQEADALRLKDIYSDIAIALNNQIESITGVSMEEEAANLLMYQKTFGANARAFSAINQSIEDIFTFIS